MAAYNFDDCKLGGMMVKAGAPVVPVHNMDIETKILFPTVAQFYLKYVSR